MKQDTALGRMDIVDALRGFSLAGIVIVHMVENYIGAPAPEGALEATHIGVIDYVVEGFIFLLLRGKFFALFSFIFGLSFFIQIDNAHKKGIDFRLRFLWRLLILFVIGYLHSLFYRGDILTVYAVLGIFLLPFYNIKNTWIIAFASLLFLGIGRYIVFLITQGGNLFMPGEFSPNSPEIIAYFDMIKNSSLLHVFNGNMIDGHLMKMDFQLGVFSRGYLTYGFFLLGLFIGRVGYFRNYFNEIRLTKYVLYWSIGLFFVSLIIAFASFAQIAENVTFDNWPAMIGLTAFDINNLAMTFIIVCLFVLGYNKVKGKRLLNAFIPYGRIALTNYFLQSVIGTFIFYGWGLNYLGELRNAYSFLLAILIIILQMIISKWWLSQFYYGPLEWIWRSITYFKVYPLKRKK
jgi:uncharacterized protein